MNKSLLNSNPKNPSLDPKEDMVLNKEISSPNKDRIGLVRSPSTLSHIIQGNMNNDSKSSGKFFSHDRLEDTDRMEDTSSNILIENFENVNWENTAEVKKILMEPVPKEYGIVKCYVKRYRGKSRLCPEYRVYLDGSNQFLMTSKKRANKTTSNYLISIGRNDYSKSSCNIIGKLRANFLGTEFQIYDAGKNPKYLDSFFDEKNYDEPRSELGAVLYSSNIIGNRGPRKMQVCINRVSEHGNCVKRWQPAIKGEEMLECFKAKNEIARKHLLFYENRQPKWNEDIGSYVLNFDKRVSLASVKNFQLIDPASSNGNVLMQFGKKGQDEFIMDVQYPMSLFQAFAISLSSCDSKLGVD
jgi:tubby-related protein 1